MAESPSSPPLWKKIARITGGILLLIVGCILGPMPILPGIPFLLGGLTLLSYDIPWARRLRRWCVVRWNQRRSNKSHKSTCANIPR